MKDRGITLIALVITIIVLLILAGITINMILGQEGILARAQYAKIENEKAQIEEELELEITDLEARQLGEVRLEDIAERFRNLGIQITTEEEDGIEGEYKNYEFLVDEKKEVIVGGKLEGEKPKVVIGMAVDDESGNIKIQVLASRADDSIEPTNGATLILENSKSNKVFEVSENGIYRFKVTGRNGRVSIVKAIVNNIAETIETKSIIEGVSKINSSGIKTVRVIEKEYSINTILYEGDVKLDGNMELIGSILTETIYEFGNKSDVATQTEEAKNTVLLKINGNLTIEEGVTLTSCKSNNGYGGPKGMIIYCTGTFKNNGTISMTGRGAKAQGEDVYLWKNENNSYEYIPALGGLGKQGVRSSATSFSVEGLSGNNGINRQTAGGGSGGARGTYSISGASGNGTSYSGGTGGGGTHTNGSDGITTIIKAENGSNTGGAGGNGAVREAPSEWAASGGVGNPGGKSYSWQDNKYLMADDGKNGTGGLLTIYANYFNNNNNIESKGLDNRSLRQYVSAGGGASGGGSINIFYNNLISRGNLDSSGGSAIGHDTKGGAGGTGSITIGNISTGSFECDYKNY